MSMFSYKDTRCSRCGKRAVCEPVRLKGTIAKNVNACSHCWFELVAAGAVPVPRPAVTPERPRCVW